MMVAGLVAGRPRLNPGREIGGSSPTHSAHFSLRLGYEPRLNWQATYVSRSILKVNRWASRPAMYGMAAPQYEGGEWFDSITCPLLEISRVSK